MYNLNAFANDDVPKYGEEGEDGGECRLAVDDEEGHVVDFEAIGQVSHTCSTGVGMGNDNDFVSTIDEFLVEVREMLLKCVGGFLHLTAGTCDSRLLLRLVR